MKRKRAGRAGRGQGHARLRADGRWEYRFYLVADDGLQRRRVSVFGSTQAEAIKKGRELQSKYDRGLIPFRPDPRTFETFAGQWLAGKKKAKAENTIKNYARELKLACEYIGKKRLNEIRPLDIKQMLDGLANRGLCGRTLKKVKARVQAVFQSALQLELIHRDPSAGVRVEAPPAEPVGRSLEPSEALALFEAADDHRAGLLIQLLLLTGLRRGEALALRWKDIDLEATPPYLRVVGNWTRGVKNHLSRLKTPRARRVVPLPPELVERLWKRKKELLADYPAKAVEDWFVFALPGAEQPYTPTYTSNVLKNLCQKAGISQIRTHDLRHTYGSLLLARGEKLERVAELLGHASPVVTLGIYRHVLADERNTPPLSLRDFNAHPRHTA